MVRKSFRSLICALAAAATGLALAQPAHAGDGDEKEKIVVTGDKPETKKVCKVETKLGSNMPRRICREVSIDEAGKMNGLDEMRDARDIQQNTQRMGKAG